MNDILTRFIDFLWLGGPVFTKELLVSSRRRRNYFVRFAYPAVLAAFIASVWAGVYSYRGSSATIFQAARSAQVGIYITTVIVWFQFIVVQVLAIIMLSTAISDEIYHKTLGVLMTTPINSFQIVFSKMLSKLFQLLLIVSISLPVLAIVRIFGGVPWSFVLSSFCITLTAAIFAGSLSLIFSIYNRQSHLVVSRTVLACFFIYAMPLLVYTILKSGVLGGRQFAELIPGLGLFFINPFMLMRSITVHMLSPGPFISFRMWLWHCAAMLGLSAGVLIWSSFCVRKAGLRQVTGQAGLFLTRRERKIADKKQRQIYSTAPVSGKIRDIKWPPIIWREIANPLIKSNRIASIFSLMLAVAFLSVAYGLCYYYEVLRRTETHIAFVLVYLFIVLVRTSTYASTSITSEKEARTWPILLTSTLTEKEIAYGKIIGSCLRAWPYWLILACHLLVFTLAGIIQAGVIIPVAFLAISSALLVSAVGVLFSSICRRNSTSSTLNIIAFLIFSLPICCTPLFVCSPVFAVLLIFHFFGGYNGGGFNASVHSPFYVLEMLFFSQFSFILYVIGYLLLTYVAYAFSVSNVRWRIL
jgi:ABC-2 type transport system permease protein